MSKELERAQVGQLETYDKCVSALRNWLSEKTDATINAYKETMVDFADFLQEDDPAICLLKWGTAPYIVAKEQIDNYRTHLRFDRKLSPTTIAPRLSALRSFSKYLYNAGLVDRPVSTSNYKLTESTATGCTDADWTSLVDTCRSDADAHVGKSREKRALRDLAILRLLHDIGLRRKEVAALELEDVDYARKVFHIQPKGPRDGRKRWPVDGLAWDCTLDWIEVRGDIPGSLFGVQLGTINKILLKRSRDAGCKVSPHQLRHHAITAANRITGNLAEAQSFARHADPRTTSIYIDTDFDEKVRELQRKIGNA